MISVVPRSVDAHGPVTPLRRGVGDGVAVVLVVASAFAPVPGTQFTASPLGFVLLAVPAFSMLLRRRWPLPVLAVCVTAYVVAAVAGMLWPGALLAMAIAMFSVGNRSSRRTTLIAALAAIVVVAPFAALPKFGSVADPAVFAVAATLAFAAAAGDGARSRREYIVAITERAERAEQTRESEARRRVSEERLRIARDLHDAVAHQIAVISLNAGVAASAIDSRPAAAKDAVRTIRSAAHAVLGEIGALLEVLRTDDDADTATSPQPGLDRVDELIGRFGEAGLAVTIRTEGDPRRVRGATDLIAYRVIQEGLTNAHKHGADARAHVLIQVGDESVRIAVTNPTLPAGVAPHTGEDADPTDTAGSGLGLLGLRERVAAVRGAVEVGAVPGGWRLSATLPLTKEEDP